MKRVAVAQGGAVLRAGLERHLHPGAHRRDDVGVGASVLRPNILAAADQLEQAVVDAQQHGGALTLWAGEAEVQLPARAAAGPPADRRGGSPAAAPRRAVRLRDRPAMAAIAKCAPRRKNSERLFLRMRRRRKRKSRKDKIAAVYH